MLNPHVEADLAAFRLRAKGQYRRIDSAIALRLINRRDQVHPNDVWAVVWRDEELAAFSAEANRVACGHRVWGPVMIDGGLLVVVDLTRVKRARHFRVTNPALPDGWRRR